LADQLLPHQFIISEAPPTAVTWSVKLLPHKCWNSPQLQVKTASERGELKSIKEDSENMSDPKPCRMKHTEEQRGWCLFIHSFIHDAEEHSC